MSSAQETPNGQQLRYFKYLTWRKEGQPIEPPAAEYGLGSPQTLYCKLRQEGFPVCEVCGGYSVSSDHCSRGDRRAHGGEGDVIELPPAHEAKELFGQAMDRLRCVLGYQFGNEKAPGLRLRATLTDGLGGTCLDRAGVR